MSLMSHLPDSSGSQRRSLEEEHNWADTENWRDNWIQQDQGKYPGF